MGNTRANADVRGVRSFAQCVFLVIVTRVYVNAHRRASWEGEVLSYLHICNGIRVYVGQPLIIAAYRNHALLNSVAALTIS